MASQPQAELPLFYKSLVPLQTGVHGKFHSRPSDRAPYFAETHAVPLTIDEFILAQRHFPIVFSVGDAPVPLGLFGLNEGVNVFTDDDGKLKGEVYVPAYVRRYPWMLAKLTPTASELSLCFDPTTDMVGEFEDGDALFEGEKPSEAVNNLLKFCEEFELSAQRTAAFVKELKELDLLMDGEVSIQTAPDQPPYVYRGFQMVSEEKFRELRGDTLRKINQNGILALVVAHLFSLAHIQGIFARQMQAGKLPTQQSPVLTS
jgi:SapC